MPSKDKSTSFIFQPCVAGGNQKAGKKYLLNKRMYYLKILAQWQNFLYSCQEQMCEYFVTLIVIVEQHYVVQLFLALLPTRSPLLQLVLFKYRSDYSCKFILHLFTILMFFQHFLFDLIVLFIVHQLILYSTYFPIFCCLYSADVFQLLVSMLPPIVHTPSPLL